MAAEEVAKDWFNSVSLKGVRFDRQKVLLQDSNQVVVRLENVGGVKASDIFNTLPVWCQPALPFLSYAKRSLFFIYRLISLLQYFSFFCLWLFTQLA